MGGLLGIFLSWFGAGPLGKIIDGINTANRDALNAKTLEEKIAANERGDRLRAQYADIANARSNVSTLPWWAATIFVMLAFPFAVHAMLIGIGTFWVAPGDWNPTCVNDLSVRAGCYVDGHGWLEWTRHIPPFPKPFDTREADVFNFFFGASVGLGVAGAAVKVASILKRKAP
jgi:hypothetical protein